jgi:UTP--glucose-1-phosphate uridylyltransferase
MAIRKAIIPSAGLGTRFLPATKSIPKEMLPLIDRPAIQYSVEEGIRAGIENFVLVTGKNKQAIEDHFDINPELQSILKSRDQLDLISSITKIMEQADFTSVRQREPLGLGHAIWSARHTVGKEHIAVFLPDEIITGKVPAISQLMKIAEQEKCNVVAVQEVPLEDVSRYGIIAIKKQFSPNLFQVKSLVEKPTPIDTPTNLAIIGRYILSPNIFDALEETQASNINGEIQLTDGIQNLLTRGEKVFAYKIQGTRYDSGTLMGWLKANIALALKHPKYSQEMQSYLRNIDRDLLVMEGQAEAIGKKSRELSF